MYCDEKEIRFRNREELTLKSKAKTFLIDILLVDWVVPLFPIYQGDMMLSCICMSVFSGIGYALIYMRDTSTGGADFVLMAIHKAKPHISVGKIIIVMDFIIVIIGGILMRGNIDKIIYGLIGTYILSFVVDNVYDSRSCKESRFISVSCYNGIE